ncbi:hypothetical protein JOB18_029348 [Solea senegalensis]|uniref:Uncharacterized protein n=1 Tax=Solea senegalensis TaxID=28829 RepID=A0AAV6Q3C9_SOLSE|nr:hypothetical protein JOB18_029348 [Solea senegalensis]
MTERLWTPLTTSIHNERSPRATMGFVKENEDNSSLQKVTGLTGPHPRVAGEYDWREQDEDDQASTRARQI